MDAENRLAAVAIRQVHDDAPVEAPRTQQRTVEHVRLVGGGEHDDALATREAVHLGQDLVQRLLLFAGAADGRRSPRPADGIELVDEDDGGRIFARLLEKIAHARGADAHDHLDELGRAHREERHAGFARDGLGQQCLARSGRADQQHPFRRRTAKARVLGRIAQEIDDFDQLVLGLVDARDVLERHLRVLLLVVSARPALADAKETAAEPPALLRRAAEEPHVKADQQQRRAEAEKKRRQRIAALGDRLGADFHVVVDQELLEPGPTNDGTVVSNVAPVRGGPWRGTPGSRRSGAFAAGAPASLGSGYVTAARKRPVIVSPRL